MMEDASLGRFDHVCHHRHDSSSHRRSLQLKEKEVFQTVHLERGVEDAGERSCISENNWMVNGCPTVPRPKQVTVSQLKRPKHTHTHSCPTEYKIFIGPEF